MRTRHEALDEGYGGVIALCLKIVFIVLLAMAVLFLYLMQRIKSRELDQEIARLRQEQAEVVKNLNQLDWRIEQLKSPERIKPLAREILGMQERLR